jgi:hypothetical protein
MPANNGEFPDLEYERIASRPLERVPEMWPLGRMIVVVFAICLATWVTVIAYLLLP